ncbi:hypothetical protein BD324DRAFT_651196 [Kockovaella imperatae]|uniref:Uncharacterized protein n=1 Tax=Kockovaella imperatae TaxID=4999 RepID=A0A1Y1UF62_9TREE|nr:hypothetical protein BD324DRAFT_651196 [Kockovaella imperatae]ORX36711.1 hypothetical protein BD324DRAFT_651196 [Kockovaella imperatae]
MSVSSGTTLISPSATSTVHRHPPAPQRKGSGLHGHHTSHGHHAKRKPSTGAHTSGRRGSETESGKRALAAGLAMHALEAAGAEVGKGKRRVSSDRPLNKSSRSDTHLPRLSRTTSLTSNPSDQALAVRPKIKDRKRSGESVEVVDEDGEAVSRPVESSEEEWEESGDEKQAQPPVRPSASSTKLKGKAKIVAAEASTPMRRTQSDTQAQPPSRSRSIITSPLALQAIGSGDLVGSGGSNGSASSGPLHPRQRTLGFAGPQAVGDPQTNAQKHINEMMPHWNDSTHVMPAHQLRHQKSFSALSQGGGERTRSVSNGTHHAPVMNRRVTESSMDQTEEEEEDDEDGQILINKSHGSSPKAPTIGKRDEPVPTSQPMTDDTPRTSRMRKSAPADAIGSGRPHQRHVSAANSTHRLRHRPSNSSLRSLQSLRAPPHPLNSPTGYRSGLPPSRSGTASNSPVKERGPSMHHPPIAPPVVYREVATGHGWDIPEDGELGTPVKRSATLPNGSSGSSTPAKSRPMERRQASISSTKSLQSHLRPQPSPSSSTTSHPRSRTTSSATLTTPRRRQTALEVTTKASKLQSTNDPVLYHHSLGHSSTSAETAHLISRFLPQKKATRPQWEISIDNLDEHSGIGLSRGDYRDAHESLIRSMRELGVSTTSTKQAARRLSYQSLLGTTRDVTSSRSGLGIAGGADGEMAQDGMGVGVGMVSGKNGPMIVAKGGGWRGKTPFELSVERCLAQRPVRTFGPQ